jgi:hypothetical protein
MAASKMTLIGVESNGVIMFGFQSVFRLVTLASFFVIAIPFDVFAQVTYTYAGTNIHGAFTMAEPLPPNQTYGSSFSLPQRLTSFSFLGPYGSLDCPEYSAPMGRCVANNTRVFVFFYSTDADSNLTGWHIGFTKGEFGDPERLTYAMFSDADNVGFGSCSPPFPPDIRTNELAAQFAPVCALTYSNNPGSWSRSSSLSCSVAPLSPLAPDAVEFEPFSPNDPPPFFSLFAPQVDATLDHSIAQLISLYPSVSRESGYRPRSYQRHLLEVFEKNQDLMRVVREDPILVSVCAQLSFDLAREIDLHKLRGPVSLRSAHSSLPAQAVDLNVGQLWLDVAGSLSAYDLTLPCVRDQAFHVSVRGRPCSYSILGTAHSPVAIEIRDPLGRRIGVNLDTGLEINEIGTNARYSGHNSEPQIIHIEDPVPGVYQLNALGTGEGPYTLVLQRLGEHDEVVDTIKTTGEATLGAKYVLAKEMPRQIMIDVKPDSDDNVINRRANGVVPVAILSSATLDAPAEILKDTLTVGVTGDEQSTTHCAPEHVNLDERKDLVCKFRIQGSGLLETSRQVILRARTRSGAVVEGADWVRIKDR